MTTRRDWISLVARGSAAMVVAGRAARAMSPADGESMTVYKSPTCGCCRGWVEHVRGAGFRVTTNDIDDVTPIKTKYGVPSELQSCHTALVGGYVIEGHVPADVIKQLLKEKPKVIGLAVGGMPMGSPGMEGARKDHYDVMAFERGKARVYAKR